MFSRDRGLDFFPCSSLNSSVNELNSQIPLNVVIARRAGESPMDRGFNSEAVTRGDDCNSLKSLLDSAIGSQGVIYTQFSVLQLNV